MLRAAGKGDGLPRNRTRGERIPAPERVPRAHDHVAAEPTTENVSAVSALQRVRSAPASAIRGADLLALQRTIGNRAVQVMLEDIARRGQSASSGRVDATTEPPNAPRVREGDQSTAQGVEPGCSLAG